MTRRAAPVEVHRCNRSCVSWLAPTPLAWGAFAVTGVGLASFRRSDAADPPPAVRVNEVRFKAVLEAGAGESWRREGIGNRNSQHRYRRFAVVPPPAVEEGGAGVVSRLQPVFLAPKTA